MSAPTPKPRDRFLPTPDSADGQIEDLICTLLGQLGAHDGASLQHSFRVAQLAGALGQALRLSPTERRELHWSALLHDIGKLFVPTAILNKPAALTVEERRWVDLHAQGGAALLAAYKVLPASVIQVARHHHDPHCTPAPGPRLSLPVRIVAVADVYDALTSARPYKPAWTREAALAELQRCAGHCFDPQLVAVFAQMLTAPQA
ncbi:HD-GYP domain-containing protein [Deinococcus hopiensis]|uniref:HD-GYP domain-containing protein n=1 Tax=Deinococcus hopiensis TaxID=309885 RepID=UPI001483C5E8|nr:HD domain-containing phosphohydrolase [Deinococcus hopiensis]